MRFSYYFFCKWHSDLVLRFSRHTMENLRAKFQMPFRFSCFMRPSHL
jgi:hypothetical protein